MTTSRSHKKELIKKLKDKEYRDAFVASHISNGIPFQIRALREQRKMTQRDLAERAGKQQSAIGRIENPNYESCTLATLKDMASAFDVALIVRFVPFSELAEWDINLAPKSLEVLSFDQEPYFQAGDEDMPENEQYVKLPITETSKVVDIEMYRNKTLASSSTATRRHPIDSVAIG